MAKNELPLKDISIDDLFVKGEKSVFEIPIYQRNYTWEKDEITVFVQDIYDAFKKDHDKPYYIGTLVTYNKGDRVFEIIDGQQRLTTLRLLLYALDINTNNKLTYRARKKSDDTLNSIPEFDIEEKDSGIENGYKHVKSAIEDIVPIEDRQGFIKYFKNYVHIIHYEVPKNIDLNHFFEIMNSRGEQLEKQEIVKAQLMEKLDKEEQKAFNCIWECCAEMNVYEQRNLYDIKPEMIFGKTLDDFQVEDFEDFLKKYKEGIKFEDDAEPLTLNEIISLEEYKEGDQLKDEVNIKDSFLPIIDFPNFLLIVLKITRMNESCFSPLEFNLDDKDLLNEFNKANMNAEEVRLFAYNLLKARFFLDNYIVHHLKEEDAIDSNPWELQVLHKEEKKEQLKNLAHDSVQDKLVHLLSMFEVSFTPKQRKNYLFYCLLHLMTNGCEDKSSYAAFVENLADRYFKEVYLNHEKLNAINTPLPGSFDEVILKENKFSDTLLDSKDKDSFETIYGNGMEKSKGIPLFVFNYLDYRLWKLYDSEVRGKKYKEGSKERRVFFEKLGCGDFGLDVFDQFYFSRTRRSLEHYYPQATATGEDGKLNENQINCLGNYAMIGSKANSSGSNWSPKSKLDHYLDSSGKISQVSVASLKFMIMMQICKDKENWEFDEIKTHQDKMISILME